MGMMGLCNRCKKTMCAGRRDDVIGCALFSAKDTNVLTHGDRIRAMSDEDLAQYLLDVEQGNFTIDCCDDRFCDTQNCYHNCTEAAIKWIKQPEEVHK